jgi:tetratricopeptide (TPR) repeat protein
MATIASSLHHAGEYAEALDCGQRALMVAADVGDLELEALSALFLAFAHFARGDHRDALVLFERAASVNPDQEGELILPQRHRRVMARAAAASCLAEVGRFAEAITAAEDAVRMADAMSDLYSRVSALFGAGRVHLLRGDGQRAITVLEHGLQLCREAEVALFLHRLLSALGYAYTLSGRADEGLALLEEAQRDTKGIVTGLSRYLAWLAEAQLHAGRRNLAAATCDRALTLAREYGERGNEAWILCLLGEMASRVDQPDVGIVEGHYREAMALADERGMRPLVAHCHIGLGRLYRRANNAAKAQGHLVTALTMCRELGVDPWPTRVEGT